ncbi:MAG: bifunctional nuclease family protein [Frankiaceae bacterium]|nr:bifunctional nuclease family protein [Frankiaceae bacterium]
MNELQVVGVRVEMPANQPIVLLKEAGGTSYLPIWIGAVEASAIAFQQQGVSAARPLTHDLLRDVLKALGATLESVRITELRDGVFFAELVFAGGTAVSARPSDAIALALRVGATIYGTEAVLAEAGVSMPEGQEEGPPREAADQAEQETQLEQFREFLDSISPDDFASGP